VSTLPYQRHSDTSHAAAVSAQWNADTQRAKVYRSLSRAGFFGRTDHELQSILAMNPSTERPRRVELVKKGLVKDSGRRRLTPSGRKAVVWVATKEDPK
jgi:hypothetical protein